MGIPRFIQSIPDNSRAYFQELFAGFPAGAAVISHSAPAGENIVEQGEPCRSVFILTEGSARVTIHRVSAKTYALSETAAGAFWGEYEVLGGLSSYLASVQARSDCRFLVVEAGDYLRWMHNDRNVFGLRARAVIRQLLHQTIHMRSSVYMNSLNRITLFLCDYYRRHAAAGAKELTVTPTHSEIGDETGFSVRTVNRAVRRLSASGLIQLRRGKMVITPKQYGSLQSALKNGAD